MRFKYWFSAALGLALTISAAATARQNIGPSGNPLPRFVAMSAGEANMRTGPGRQYPVRWVYKRRGLPLEIIDEYGAWRKVRDHEGEEGWMLVSLLYGSRSVMVRGKTRNLHAEPNLSAPVRLTADPGVIGVIERCRDRWCEVTVDGTSAWIERRHVWGVYATEELD